MEGIWRGGSAQWKGGGGGPLPFLCFLGKNAGCNLWYHTVSLFFFPFSAEPAVERTLQRPATSTAPPALRPYIGVEVNEVRTSHGLDLVVRNVLAGGGADEAGILVGDYLVKWNGNIIRSKPGMKGGSSLLRFPKKSLLSKTYLKVLSKKSSLL